MTSRVRRTIRSTLLAACLAAAPAVAAPEAAAPAAPPAIPDRALAMAGALDLSYEDINPNSATSGRRLTLSELWSDRGIVLSFVASWCGFCREELPHLQALHAAGEAFVVGVAADEGDASGKGRQIRRLIEEARLTIPVLFVPAADLKKVEAFYDYSILPATYLIDRHGNVRDAFEGMQPRSTLSEAVGRSLAP